MSLTDYAPPLSGSSLAHSFNKPAPTLIPEVSFTPTSHMRHKPSIISPLTGSGLVVPVALPKEEFSKKLASIFNIQPSISLPVQLVPDSLIAPPHPALHNPTQPVEVRSFPRATFFESIRRNSSSFDHDPDSDESLNRPEKSNVVYSDKKRKDRNLREQKRSTKISRQINRLQNVLSEAGARSKSNKHSVLSGIVSYIHQLQKQNKELEVERHRWMIENSDPLQMTCDAKNSMARSNHKGINYKHVFNHAGLGAAVATIDGKFFESNKRFGDISGFTENEIKNMTLFNLTVPHDLQRMFSVIGQMLNKSNEGSEHVFECLQPKHEFECQQSRKRVDRVKMSLSLMRSEEGTPLFFHCTLLPIKTPPGQEGMCALLNTKNPSNGESEQKEYGHSTHTILSEKDS